MDDIDKTGMICRKCSTDICFAFVDGPSNRALAQMLVCHGWRKGDDGWLCVVCAQDLAQTPIVVEALEDPRRAFWERCMAACVGNGQDIGVALGNINQALEAWDQLENRGSIDWDDREHPFWIELSDWDRRIVSSLTENLSRTFNLQGEGRHLLAYSFVSLLQEHENDEDDDLRAEHSDDLAN